MPVDHEAELDAAEQAILDNAAYRGDLSGVQARAYAAAQRRKAALLPSVSTKGANSVSYSVEACYRAAAEADRWADDVASSPEVVRVDFRSARRYG